MEQSFHILSSAYYCKRRWAAATVTLTRCCPQRGFSLRASSVGTRAWQPPSTVKPCVVGACVCAREKPPLRHARTQRQCFVLFFWPCAFVTAPRVGGGSASSNARTKQIYIGKAPAVRGRDLDRWPRRRCRARDPLRQLAALANLPPPLTTAPSRRARKAGSVAYTAQVRIRSLVGITTQVQCRSSAASPPC